MPKLNLCRRKLNIASDDFTFPSSLSAVYRVAICGIYAATVARLVIWQEEIDNGLCQDSMIGFHASALGLCAVGLVLDLVMVYISVQGTPTSVSARASMPTFTSVRLLLAIISLVGALAGLTFPYWRTEVCPNDSITQSHYIFLRNCNFIASSLTIMNDLQFSGPLVIMMFCTFVNFGPKESDVLDAESFNASSTSPAALRWAGFCRSLSCLCSSAAEDNGSSYYEAIGQILASVFTPNLDLAFSDVIAALTLVRSEQKDLERAAVSSVDRVSTHVSASERRATDISNSSMSITLPKYSLSASHHITSAREHSTSSTGAFKKGISARVMNILSPVIALRKQADFHKSYISSDGTLAFTGTPNEILRLRESAHFMDFAFAAYGWPLYVFANLPVGLCTLPYNWCSQYMRDRLTTCSQKRWSRDEVHFPLYASLRTGRDQNPYSNIYHSMHYHSTEKDAYEGLKRDNTGSRLSAFLGPSTPRQTEVPTSKKAKRTFDVCGCNETALRMTLDKLHREDPCAHEVASLRFAFPPGGDAGPGQGTADHIIDWNASVLGNYFHSGAEIVRGSASGFPTGSPPIQSPLRILADKDPAGRLVRTPRGIGSSVIVDNMTESPKCTCHRVRLSPVPVIVSASGATGNVGSPSSSVPSTLVDSALTRREMSSMYEGNGENKVDSESPINRNVEPSSNITVCPLHGASGTSSRFVLSRHPDSPLVETSEKTVSDSPGNSPALRLNFDTTTIPRAPEEHTPVFSVAAAPVLDGIVPPLKPDSIDNFNRRPKANSVLSPRSSGNILQRNQPVFNSASEALRVPLVVSRSSSDSSVTGEAPSISGTRQNRSTVTPTGEVSNSDPGVAGIPLKSKEKCSKERSFPRFHMLHTSYANEIFSVPWFVAIDGACEVHDAFSVRKPPVHPKTSGGTDSSNANLLGKSESDGYLVVCCRGTLSANDLVTDAMATPLFLNSPQLPLAQRKLAARLLTVLNRDNVSAEALDAFRRQSIEWGGVSMREFDCNGPRMLRPLLMSEMCVHEGMWIAAYKIFEQIVRFGFLKTTKDFIDVDFTKSDTEDTVPSPRTATAEAEELQVATHVNISVSPPRNASGVGIAPAEASSSNRVPPPKGRLQLIVCGHSLGAGVATLLGLMLRSTNPQVRIYAFSPPAQIVSPALAAHMHSFCTSVVLDKDLVPRMSLPALLRLRDASLSALPRCRVSKTSVFVAAAFGDHGWPGNIVCKAVCGVREFSGKQLLHPVEHISFITKQQKSVSVDMPTPGSEVASIGLHTPIEITPRQHSDEYAQGNSRKVSVLVSPPATPLSTSSDVTNDVVVGKGGKDMEEEERIDSKKCIESSRSGSSKEGFLNVQNVLNPSVIKDSSNDTPVTSSRNVPMFTDSVIADSIVGKSKFTSSPTAAGKSSFLPRWRVTFSSSPKHKSSPSSSSDRNNEDIAGAMKDNTRQRTSSFVISKLVPEAPDFETPKIVMHEMCVPGTLLYLMKKEKQYINFFGFLFGLIFSFFNLFPVLFPVGRAVGAILCRPCMRKSTKYLVRWGIPDELIEEQLFRVRGLKDPFHSYNVLNSDGALDEEKFISVKAMKDNMKEEHELKKKLPIFSLSRILVSPEMISDHMPDKVAKVLREVCKEEIDF